MPYMFDADFVSTEKLTVEMNHDHIIETLQVKL